MVGGHDPAQDLGTGALVELALLHLAVEAPAEPGQEGVRGGPLRERTMTSQPALAATSARPAPMIPDPRMPTRLMTVPAMGGCYRPVGFAGSRAAGPGVAT